MRLCNQCNRMPPKIPAISIVAPASDCGKTRLITGIVSALAEQGIRACIIKHSSHDAPTDLDKDTWRFREAGAAASALLDNRGLATYYIPKSSLEDAIEAMSSQGAEIIICEGFRSSPLPKIVLIGGAEDLPLLCSLPNVAAAVAKHPIRPVAKVPVLDYDVRSVTAFIRDFCLRTREAPG